MGDQVTLDTAELKAPGSLFDSEVTFCFILMLFSQYNVAKPRLRDTEVAFQGLTENMYLGQVPGSWRPWSELA